MVDTVVFSVVVGSVVVSVVVAVVVSVVVCAVVGSVVVSEVVADVVIAIKCIQVEKVSILYECILPQIVQCQRIMIFCTVIVVMQN